MTVRTRLLAELAAVGDQISTEMNELLPADLFFAVAGARLSLVVDTETKRSEHVYRDGDLLVPRKLHSNKTW